MMRRLLAIAALAALCASAPASAWLAQTGVAPVTPAPQIFFTASTSALSQSGDRYLPIGNSSSAQISTTTRFFVASVAGTVTAMKGHSKTAIGAGSYAITLYKNGSSTSATLTLDSTHQTNDWTGTVAVSPGDTLKYLADPSSGPSPDVAPLVTFTLKFIPTTANEVIIPGSGIAGTFSNSAVNGISPFTGGGPGTISTTAKRSWRIPDGGTISNLYIASTDPVTGSYDYSAWINGAATSPAITQNIAGGATDGSDTTHSSAISAGNDVEFVASPNSTPTASNAAFGLKFVPSTSGHFVWGATISSASDSTTVTNYYAPTAGGAYIASTTEADHQAITYAQTIKAAYCKMLTAPGSGKSRTLTLRLNGADTAATCTISDTNTTGEVTGLSVAVAENDKLSIVDIPTSTPAGTFWSMTFLAESP